MTILKYALTKTESGLLAYYGHGKEKYYHIHSKGLTPLEKWIKNLLLKYQGGTKIKMVVAPIALRAMAEALQKHTKTNKNCTVDLYITSYKEGKKKLKTFGIKIGAAKKKSKRKKMKLYQSLDKKL